jgi:hypothetical protein
MENAKSHSQVLLPNSLNYSGRRKRKKRKRKGAGREKFKYLSHICPV